MEIKAPKDKVIQLDQDEFAYVDADKGRVTQYCAGSDDDKIPATENLYVLPYSGSRISTPNGISSTRPGMKIFLDGTVVRSEEEEIEVSVLNSKTTKDSIVVESGAKVGYKLGNFHHNNKKMGVEWFMMLSREDEAARDVNLSLTQPVYEPGELRPTSANPGDVLGHSMPGISFALIAAYHAWVVIHRYVKHQYFGTEFVGTMDGMAVPFTRKSSRLTMTSVFAVPVHINLIYFGLAGILSNIALVACPQSILLAMSSALFIFLLGTWWASMAVILKVLPVILPGYKDKMFHEKFMMVISVVSFELTVAMTLLILLYVLVHINLIYFGLAGILSNIALVACPQSILLAMSSALFIFLLGTWWASMAVILKVLPVILPGYKDKMFHEKFMMVISVVSFELTVAMTLLILLYVLVCFRVRCLGRKNSPEYRIKTGFELMMEARLEDEKDDRLC
ncbi:unnamed protein product [Notodromas monacha]|uniref:Uncharacterized protein n=1 Tax=Notodromas monacha TaxID=399045 RepID=A0A7R9BX23_9CRUS|nr:unnamed protein product [Notodromas monacha]CAG0922387.1 unnamed protein product [Notodromas monacha]